MADLKVVFPKPCTEQWEQMVPRGCHRHCGSCDKMIHDLSVLTIHEAEALLASGDEACVRAQIGPDGAVLLRPDRNGAARRMIAAAGASLALATAACQTVPYEGEERYQISGKFGWNSYYNTAKLQSNDGRIWQKRREPGSGRFIFDHLLPGVYTLTVEDQCGERVEVQTITITSGSIDLGVTWPATGCIIIGAMAPASRPERV